MQFFLLRNTKILIFGGISKFLKPFVVGQLLAILGRFYCIDSGYEHAQSKVEALKAL
jgi:hypothetical protein